MPKLRSTTENPWPAGNDENKRTKPSVSPHTFAQAAVEADLSMLAGDRTHVGPDVPVDGILRSDALKPHLSVGRAL